MFISRTELLPEDETTNEHEVAKVEEAVQMTADRTGDGLFKGAFRQRRLPGYPGQFDQRGVLWDPNDRVERCPDCHWELEGGRCGQCEWSVSDPEAFSDEDSDSETGTPEFEGAGMHGRIRRFDVGNFLANLEDGGHPHPFHYEAEFSDEADSVITISSDVDDIDPVDHGLAGTDADTPSEAESDLPVVMGGGPIFHHNEIPAMRRTLNGLYDSDVQSTNYDDSEMDDTNLQTTSEMDESDEDEETEDDDDSSELEDFIDHDTPTHIPHRALVHNRFDAEPGGYNNSDNDNSDDDSRTNREPSQASTTTTNTTATTVDSSSEESSEDESRRTPVPRSRPSRQTRVILDDSDEEEDQGNSVHNDSNGDETDATTIPAQPTATRRSRLQTQRARRGQIAPRRNLHSPPRRPTAPNIRGGFDNASGNRRSRAWQPAANRRGMAQTFVTG
jgi:hypothetical protein